MLELQLAAKDGTIIPAEAKFSCHVNNKGEPLSYQGVARDLRDRKKAEMERQRLIAAIEHAAEGIFLVGPDRTITYANRSLCAETGYSKEEIIGSTMDSLAGGDNERSFYTEVRNAMKAGETWSGRYTTKRKDGTSYQVEGSIVPIKDDVRPCHELCVCDKRYHRADPPSGRASASPEDGGDGHARGRYCPRFQ